MSSPIPALPPPATRFLAAVGVLLMIVLVATSAVAPQGEDAATRPDRTDHGPADSEPDSDAVEAPDAELTAYVLDGPRPWLRSVSTAPMRPRLAGDAAGASPPADLRPHNPRIRVDGPAPAALETVRDTAGVALATEVLVEDVPVRHRGRRDRLRLAFVEPGEFRVVTPRLTAEAEALWRALDDGDVALTHEAARQLGVRPGGEVVFGTFLARTSARVAGAVSLGHADVADAVMHRGARSGRDAEPILLVGIEDLDALDDVISRLVESGVGEVSALADIEPYRAQLVGDDEATAEAFEPFTFHQRDGGRIEIEPDWIAEHIVAVDLPVLGDSRCHRLIVPQLRAALEEIVDRGLDHLLDPDDYGGCWMPRHIGWDPTRALSLHAWGIAFDVNVAANPYGATPQLDLRIVEVFERHGFSWGGRWRVPDGMHFELGQLLDPGAIPAHED